jgi:hypothetical protein
MFRPTASGKIRNDDWGSGEFGAPRGQRKHAGLDFVCAPGELVLSPCRGVITDIGYCYADTPYYRLLRIHEGSCIVGLLYVKPLVGMNEAVGPGTPVGVAQNIKKRYTTIDKQMVNHVHLEVELLKRRVLMDRGFSPSEKVRVDPRLFLTA